MEALYICKHPNPLANNPECTGSSLRFITTSLGSVSSNEKIMEVPETQGLMIDGLMIDKLLGVGLMIDIDAVYHY